MTEIKVKRSQVQSFLLTSNTPETWSLIGNGVTTGTINYNPETSSETYINQDSGTTEVEKYAPNLPVESVAIKGNAAFDFVDALRKSRATLDAAHAYLMNVWLYETPANTDQYPAEKQEISIQIDSFGGDGGVATRINYTINFIGDPVTGKYDVSLGTFTADA